MVDTVRFLNPEHTVVQVEPEGWTMPYPSHAWHQQVIDEWKAAGNTIEAYVKPFNEIHSEKLLELDTCGNDAACITNITWGA